MKRGKEVVGVRVGLGLYVRAEKQCAFPTERLLMSYELANPPR